MRKIMRQPRLERGTYGLEGRPLDGEKPNISKLRRALAAIPLFRRDPAKSAQMRARTDTTVAPECHSLSLAELRHQAILAQLARAWARAPYLPLGQVIETIAAHAGTDVWGMTDDAFYLTARTWTGAMVPPGEDEL